MSRVKHVSGAMSPKGGKASSPLGKIFVGLLVITAVFFVFSMGGSSSKDANSDNLRSGQAHHSSTAAPTPLGGTGAAAGGAAATPSESAKEGEEDSDAKMAEYNLEETIDLAQSEIMDAEQDQIEMNEQGLLGKALDTMSDLIHGGVAKLLGDGADAEEVDEIAEEVADALYNETAAEFRKRADEVAEEEGNELDEVLEKAEEMGMSAEDTEEEIAEAEGDLIVKVRDGVDDAAVDIRQHLRERAMELEKQIMEQRLSKLRGRPVKLHIVDGDVEFEQDPASASPPQVPGVPPQYGQQGALGYGQNPVGGAPQASYPSQQLGYGVPQYQQQPLGYQQQQPMGGYQQPMGGYQQPMGGYQQYPQAGYQGYQQQQQLPMQGGYQQPPPQTEYQQPPPAAGATQQSGLSQASPPPQSGTPAEGVAPPAGTEDSGGPQGVWDLDGDEPQDNTDDVAPEDADEDDIFEE